MMAAGRESPCRRPRNVIKIMTRWDTGAGKIRSLSGEEEEFNSKTMDNEEVLSIAELAEVLAGRSSPPDNKTVLATLSSLGRPEVEAMENTIIDLMRSGDDAIADRAAEVLTDFGTVKSLIPFFYADLLKCFSADKSDHLRSLAFYEHKGEERILDGILGGDLWYLNPEVLLNDPERVALIRDYIPHFWLFIIKGGCQKIAGVSTFAERGKGIYYHKVEFIHTLAKMQGLHEHLNHGVIRSLTGNPSERAEQTWRLLNWLPRAGFPEEITFLFGLFILMTPGFMDLSSPDALTGNIVVALKDIFETCWKKNDSRRVLAAMALLELGVDPAWEGIVRNFYKQAAWPGWPRLMSTGEKVLRRSSPEEKVSLLEARFRMAKWEGEKRELFNRIEELAPAKAIELCEKGLFQLSPFNEGLLYGKVGDTRGYRFILEHTIELGRIEGLRYLGDFGGQDAIPMLEEALKQEAPEEIVKTALRRIRARHTKRRKRK